MVRKWEKDTESARLAVYFNEGLAEILYFLLVGYSMFMQ